MPYPHVIRLRGPWEYEPLARRSPLAPGGRGAGREGEIFADLPPPGRINLPADWSGTLGAGFRGRVRYRRRFNRPTGLEPGERVWLVIDGVDARGQYAMNGQPLSWIDGYALPAECDVTELLAASNVLEIDVELGSAEPTVSSRWPQQQTVEATEEPAANLPVPTDLRPGRERLAGGPIGEVRLEIRARAHTEDLAIYWEPERPPRLCICGRVGGSTSSNILPSPLAGDEPGVRGLALVVTACEREVLYEDVIRGSTFAFAVPIDDWPPWPDAADEPVLTPVEIRLLAGAASVWQTVRETAPPQPDDALPRLAMRKRVLAAQPLDWIDYVTDSDARWQQILNRPGTIVGLRAVLPEAAYAALDRANVAVVQQVPQAWADVVCCRLAHHPSIVAWASTPNELAAASQQHISQITFGRTWIAGA
jgi:hypothetical protein